MEEESDILKALHSGKMVKISYLPSGTVYATSEPQRVISPNIPTRETLAVIPAHAKCRDCAFVTLYEEYRDEVKISCTREFPQPITEKIKDCLPCISWKSKEEIEEQRIANKSW